MYTHSLHVHACVSHAQAKQDTLTSPLYKRTTAADAKPRANKEEDDEEGKEVLAKRCRGNKLLLLLDASKRRCPQRASWDRGMAPVWERVGR